MLPKLPAFASISSLQWINLLGAGSLAIFWTLEGSGFQPVRAISPELQQTRLELSQAQEPTDLGESEVQEYDASFTAQMQAVEQPPANFFPQETTAQSLPAEVDAAPAPQTPLQSRTLTPSAKRSHFSLPSPTPGLEEGATNSTNRLRSVLPSTTGNSNLTIGVRGQGSGVREGRFSLFVCARQCIASNQDLALARSTAATYSSSRETDSFPALHDTSEESPNRSNTTLVQLPSIAQTPPLLPVPATAVPVSSKRSNSRERQIPALPQPPNLSSEGFPASSNLYNQAVGQFPSVSQYYSPVPATGGPMPPNPYNPALGQFPYYPQAVILVPVPATGMPMSPNSYNAGVGQSQYYPQAVILVPVPATGVPMLPNPYNLGTGQSSYYPQNVPPLPAPVNPNPVGFNNYNPSLGQSPYYPQPAPPQPIAPTMIPMGATSYNPALGQYPYYPQNVPPLPAPLNSSPAGFNSYNPNTGQSFYPQTVPPLPPPLNQSSAVPNSYGGQFPYSPQGMLPLNVPPNQSAVGTTSYNSSFGQSPYIPQTAPLLPYAPNPNLTPSVPTPTTALGATPPTPQPTLNRSTALTAPSVRLQGAYVNQGDDSAARARLSALYPVNPRVQLGATVDLISGENIFSDSRGEGLNLNELYVAAAPFENFPNFRLVAGQLDLTSYFDRNSFAKDGVTHFFNPVFQTNPALSAAGIASRPAVLVNWTVTDNIEAKAAVFSSARDIGDFSLDGFAGEVGIRYGNAIIRGTYASDRDGGSRTGFGEIFGLQRSDSGTGIRSSDREQAYGVNVEYFIPQANMGIFGRYGRYDNRTLGRGGDTYSAGITFLDVFTSSDRLGLAYGRGLSNDLLRRQRGDEIPDVMELFYDFRFLPNLRLGFTLQQRNGFSDTFAGFRVRTDFDITPAGRLVP